MREHGFRLIVGRVRSGNVSEMLFLGDSREPFVACAPSGVFEVALGPLGEAGNVGTRAMEFEIKARSQLGHELLVSIGRAAAKLVIEMENAEHDAEALA